jgi:4-amino-4-deoxy-L-arabinose transferase-like glycosyltransferase
MGSGTALGTPSPVKAGRRIRLGARGRAIATHLTVLLGYLGAGIAVSWPRASYLTDHLVPGTRDAALFVWDLWWMARSVEHLSNPWFTSYQAAPVGTQLGYHTLMPLPGWLMTPVTLGFGPSVSYNLLSVAAPALMSYAMYRVARLWVASQTGAIAAGAFFGLSTMLMWNAWYELNLALGAIFLPLTLEAAVRLTRRPGWRGAVILGVVLGAALLTDQESAFMAGLLVIAALLPWLARRPCRGGAVARVKLCSATLAAAVSGVVGSPQIVAMVQQSLAGNAASPPGMLATDYVQYAAAPKQIFAPSPRVAAFGLKALAGYYYHSGQEALPIDAYGLVLLLLALGGLAVCWRRRAAWLLALFWLICTIGALGPGILAGGREYAPDAEWWHGIRVSLIMPYTWLVRLSLFSSFREANRLLELGLVPLALLAAAAVDWVRRRARAAVLAVAILASFETGVAGAMAGPVVTMSTELQALAGPIAADHSGSVVVDIPYGVRSGAPLPGQGPPFDPQAQILATEDGHPSAVGYVSRLPESTLAAVKQQPFYTDLLGVQHEPRKMTTELLTVHRRRRGRLAALKLDALRLDARRLGLGWAVVWLHAPGGNIPAELPAIERYLKAVGFRFAYQADGALVFRMKPVTSQPAIMTGRGQTRSRPAV